MAAQRKTTGRAVLISGPVGAGKTAVAKAFVAGAPGPTAYIEGDTFWSFIAKPVPGNPRQHAFRAIMRSMSLAAIPFAREGYETVLDFSIPPAFLEAIKSRFKKIEVHLIVLRPSEPVCAGRAAARSEGTILDYEPYREFYSMFTAEPRHMIEDDDSDAAHIATRIRDGITNGTFRLP